MTALGTRQDRKYGVGDKWERLEIPSSVRTQSGCRHTCFRSVDAYASVVVSRSARVTDMRTKHISHSLPAFPIYSCAFTSPNELILGGGGGQSRSGIKNKLRLYRIDSDKTFELLDELELEKGEDAPMSMAAHPQIKNMHVVVKENKMSLLRTQGTLALKGSEDDFQKVTVFSPDGSFLAVGGTHDVCLLSYPSLSIAATPIQLKKGEVYDASFSTTTLVVATTVNLLVYTLPATRSTAGSEKVVGKQKEYPITSLELIRTVERPTLPGKDAGSSFRAARYNPKDEKVLYTIMNTVPPRTRTKSSQDVGDRGLTCFDVSPNGKLLAFGSSDYTVGILDAQTLAPLLTILKAHELPPTTLRFNPSSNLLVSGSADNTIRVVAVPTSLGESSWSSWIFIVVALLIILFAILAKQMHHVLDV
ncbi:Guanine nucleotide-exchange factor SEC12 [Grifola frondosa]|uniref:Guanine nucleotide-exchange factor SEC12 n=1 Tax=Grifola frondosa TaxID=5627 RepID=A0A1C7MMB3_GRIFR|nr:Guanine nucleotide-exchange factor SEC12 [Grifola frondosa]